MSQGGVAGGKVQPFLAENSIFTQASAQDGVDKTGLGGQAHLAGQFHGGMDGGMTGNAVEPKNLVQTEAQENAEQGTGWSGGNLAGGQPIQGGLPPHDAKDKFLAKRPVGALQGVERQGAFQERFGEIA